MNKKKTFSIVFSLIGALCLFGFVWSWFVTKDLRDAGQDYKTEQKFTVSNLLLTETKNAKKYWELYAKKAQYDGNDKNVFLYDILGNFYNENNEVTLSLKASKGSYNEQTGVIMLEGNAYAVSKDNSSVLADRVVWKGQDEDIMAFGNVQINKDNQLITNSKKAVFSSDFTYFKIEGDTKSNLYGKENSVRELDK